MSSYVINKKDYTRCAAVIAAIGTNMDHYREQVFYKYNFKESRLFTADDFKAEILSLYDLNAESVQKQYGDKTRATDPNDYQSEYDKYFKLTNILYHKAFRYGTLQDKSDFKNLIYYMADFFRSIDYQIEGKEESEKADKILNYYRKQFIQLLHNLDAEDDTLCWGNFDFFESDK